MLRALDAVCPASHALVLTSSHVSYIVQPFLWTLYTELKGCFCSVSLMVELVLFTSLLLNLLIFFKRCKFFHRPQCLDLTPLPIGAPACNAVPACNAHACLGHWFSAFWLLSKKHSLLISYLTIQSFSVIKLIPILNYCSSMRIATVLCRIAMSLFSFSFLVLQGAISTAGETDSSVF